MLSGVPQDFESVPQSISEHVTGPPKPTLHPGRNACLHDVPGLTKARCQSRTPRDPCNVSEGNSEPADLRFLMILRPKRMFGRI
jgi:hypothetical protein